MTAPLELGEVVHVQVHIDRVAHDGIYDPSRLLAVDELLLSGNGAVGWVGDRAVLDGHHLDHPTRRPKQYDRVLSVGFTAHYDAMSERFGSAPIGIAAENIVISSSRPVTEVDIAAGLTIGTGDDAITLIGPRVAAPCVPFTKFMLGDPDAGFEVVKLNRAFLHDGMRGFVLGVGQSVSHGRVRVGDPVEAQTAQNGRV